MDWRRILLIIGLLLSAVGIALILYFVFFAPVAPPVPIAPPAVVPPPVAGVLPPAGVAPPAEPVAPTPLAPVPAAAPTEIAQGGITKTNLTATAQVLSPQLSADQSAINYYDPNRSQFFRVTADGRSELISSKIFPNVQNVAWAPTSDQAIIEFPDGANVLFNFNTQEQVTLPSHWQEFKFSAASDQIAFKSIGTDVDNRWLAVATPDGDQVRVIEPLGDNARKLIVDFSPNGQMIGMFTESIDINRSELFFVGQNGENFKSTTLEGQGFVGQWSPRGDKILYSVHSNQTDNIPELWVVDATGENIGNNKKRIGLNTWADKCVMASDNITAYCAVPINLPKGAGLVRAAAKNFDTLYKVNTITGSFDLLAIPDSPVIAENLILNADESTLNFVDTFTSLVKNVKIK